MGVELKLLITNGSADLAHQQLEMPNDSLMFDALDKKLQKSGFDCPREGVSCYHAIDDKDGHIRYGKRTENTKSC